MIFFIAYKSVMNFYKLFFYLFFMNLITIPSFAAAHAEHQPIRQYMQEVLQHEDFQTYKEVTEWRYINDEEKAEQSKNRLADLPRELLRRLLGSSEEKEENFEGSDWFSLPRGLLLWLAQFTEVLLWTVLVLGLLALLWALYRNTHWHFQQQHNQQKKAQPNELEMILHNNEVLPDHPAQAAWICWQKGEARAAISLLYRASLQHLRQNEGLSLPDSATEGECLRLIKRTQVTTRSHYCSRLTHTWQALAYAHQLPDEWVVRNLCDDWDTQFLQTQA